MRGQRHCPGLTFERRKIAVVAAHFLGSRSTSDVRRLDDHKILCAVIQSYRVDLKPFSHITPHNLLRTTIDEMWSYTFYIFRSMNGLLLSIQDTAKQLNVSVRTVRRMIEAGELPVVRVRRSVRIPANALETWVEKQATLENNTSCAGPDVRGGNNTCGSANKTVMVSTIGLTHRISGHRTPIPGADELGVLLGYRRRGKDEKKQRHY